MISIDGYSDVERIGQGGLGDVYRARRDSTGATVAIKVLRDVSDESVAWHRTRRELTALVSLAGHANVIQLIEMLELAEGPALVMEHAPGGSVAELLVRRDEPLSVGETVLVGRQTAAALTAAHARGIVHRDVKPQNLLIDAYGQVKLCDFGIAAMARTEEFQVRTSAISMRYTSPEDLEESAEVGPASDVYSLGATMLHLARGAPPTLKERLAPWLPPATDDPELAALDRIMAACLHPLPERRPSAADVADDLERLAWSIDERNRSMPMVEPGEEDGVAATAPSATPYHPESVPASHPRPDVREPPTDDDVTLHRADRVRVEPPRPAPSRPRRPRRVVATTAAVVAVAAIAVVAYAVLDGGDDDGPTGVEPTATTAVASGLSVVARPGGLPPLTDAVLPSGPVGECLVQGDGDLQPVDCDVAHDVQRIAAGILDGDADDAAFDRERVRAAVTAACASAAAELDDLPADADRPFGAPSAATWDDGDRAYDCFVAVLGRRLVGSALGD